MMMGPKLSAASASAANMDESQKLDGTFHEMPSSDVLYVDISVRVDWDKYMLVFLAQNPAVQLYQLIGCHQLGLRLMTGVHATWDNHGLCICSALCQLLQPTKHP